MTLPTRIPADKLRAAYDILGIPADNLVSVTIAEGVVTVVQVRADDDGQPLGPRTMLVTTEINVVSAEIEVQVSPPHFPSALKAFDWAFADEGEGLEPTT